MSSVINTNVKALTAQGSLNAVNNKMSQAMQRLSTGLRINSSKDDAAGLAITNKMTADIRGLAVAIRNANDGLSLAQTAEGAMSSITGMLQRMRELAVQSANGTSSSLARQGSQLEIEQLKQEIDNISARTSFNGIKLLDGSAASLVLQTGSEIGQTMNLKLDSVSTSSIGIGSRASLSAYGTFDENQVDTTVDDTSLTLPKVMSSGDLIINGVVIRGSNGDDDILSYATKERSAIAKAAAINSMSAQTGVKAVVSETYAAGHGMVAGDGTDDGYLTINGVKSSLVVADTDNGVTRGRVVTAVNAIAHLTGVTAVDTGDDNNGIVLKAADGRNITVDLGDLTPELTGLREGTTTAGFSLQSINGSAINLSASATGDIATAGLSAGSFKANTSVLTTGQRDVLNEDDLDVDNNILSTSKWSAGTLKINGVAIAGTDPASDTASATADENGDVIYTSSRSNSAIAIAAAINKSSAATGVTAVVNANVITGSEFTAGDYTAADKVLYLNGISITFGQSTGFDGTQTRQEVADFINSYSGRTGVVVTDNGRGLTYTAVDGRNISMATDLAADTDVNEFGFDGTDDSQVAHIKTGAASAQDAVTTYATFSFVSDKQFTLTSGSEGGEDGFAAMKLSQGTFGGDSNGFKVSEIDISTQDGATAALQALDAALDTVNFSQSRLGALQNRLDSAISNLTEVSRNTSESRSRILDADYATETTNLAKAQIVQQAATAMLAQANQSAQSVLSLLK